MKRLQIIGGGCAKRCEFAQRTQTAATGLGLEFGMEKVSDLRKIVGFGVMRTPALVVDGAVKVAGRVPSVKGVGMVKCVCGVLVILGGCWLIYFAQS